jgi:hypothetical protein
LSEKKAVIRQVVYMYVVIVVDTSEELCWLISFFGITIGVNNYDKLTNGETQVPWTDE